MDSTEQEEAGRVSFGSCGSPFCRTNTSKGVKMDFDVTDEEFDYTPVYPEDIEDTRGWEVKYAHAAVDNLAAYKRSVAGIGEWPSIRERLKELIVD